MCKIVADIGVVTIKSRAKNPRVRLRFYQLRTGHGTMDVIIDGAMIDSAQKFHDFVADVFDLPYYGANSDALWDVLTRSIERPVHVKWVNARLSRKGMGAKEFDLLSGSLREAAERDKQFNHPQLDFSLSE